MTLTDKKPKRIFPRISLKTADFLDTYFTSRAGGAEQILEKFAEALINFETCDLPKYISQRDLKLIVEKNLLSSIILDTWIIDLCNNTDNVYPSWFFLFFTVQRLQAYVDPADLETEINKMYKGIPRADKKH